MILLQLELNPKTSEEDLASSTVLGFTNFDLILSFFMFLQIYYMIMSLQILGWTPHIVETQYGRLFCNFFPISLSRFIQKYKYKYKYKWQILSKKTEFYLIFEFSMLTWWSFQIFNRVCTSAFLQEMRKPWKFTLKAELVADIWLFKCKQILQNSRKVSILSC